MTTPSLLVLTNPRSGANRRDRGLAGRLRQLVPDARLEAPADLEALAHVVRDALATGVTRVAVHGGDGTLHRVLTAWHHAAPDAAMPEVAILRGGTMNIVADSVGVREKPEVFLPRVTSGDVRLTTRRLLRVEVDDAPPVVGFLSGNGIVARFLEKYYETEDPTPADAARLLLRGSLSAMVGGRLARDLVRPYVGAVIVDGERLTGERWTAVAIGSVEQMGLGFRVFHRIGDRLDAFQVVALGGSIADLARELPSLYRGRGVHRPKDSVHVIAELRLEADEPIPMMVDGDFYRADRGRVRIALGPTVPFVT
ncbi:MAG: diacylglycerol kinase [Alphaproteobacteria bacterium]|nr:diacylglycerol kinase [Alphaproteobacteria bacterium]MCB9699300.1 diacylglycerol kinase [Alphaproteobacteria bacterium]